ncbi:MAG: hypothetical protein FJW66_00450 [Actinobacteria bacterium]|nr:hypothetical protein [Actinomycetota bacterium]
MEFIADIMVGKLAKYLRMAGNDVLYDNSFSDEEILEIAKKDNRIILTRDSVMLQRKECVKKIIRSILIKDDRLAGQLRQVKTELQLDLKPNLVRCIDCNSMLSEVEKKDVENRVPAYVFKTQEHFLYCCICNKYYWRGTHYESINKTFKNINGR